MYYRLYIVYILYTIFPIYYILDTMYIIYYIQVARAHGLSPKRKI